MTDVLDDLSGVQSPDTDSDVEPVVPGEVRTDLFVCEHVNDDDGSLCGATFSDANRLRLHGYGKHRDRSNDRPGGRPKGSKTKTTKRAAEKKPSRAPQAAASSATGHSTSRSATYASSISMAALGAYLVVPPFDQTDLGIVNAGASNLATALADAGDQNDTVRKTCDLILGGGSGGAYLQLLLAVSAIAVPICAHHGLLPEAAGSRFGEMIGAPASVHHPAAPTGDGAPDTEPSRSGALDPTNPDDVLAFMTRVPETVMFDLAGKMMSGGMGPTVVEVPFSQPPVDQPDEMSRPTGDDSDGGSEQLNPESTRVEVSS